MINIAVSNIFQFYEQEMLFIYFFLSITIKTYKKWNLYYIKEMIIIFIFIIFIFLYYFYYLYLSVYYFYL